MIIPALGGLNAVNSMNNSAYGWMRSADALTGLCSFSGLQNVNLAALNEMDKRLTIDMHQNSLIYKLSSLMEKRFKKLQDEDIKRSFSTFA